MIAEPIFVFTYKTPIGELLIGTWQNQLILCDWKYRSMRASIDARLQRYTNSSYHSIKLNHLEAHGVIKNTIQQLEAYLNGDSQNFTIPLCLAGTDFQIKVWKQLLQIPFGKTISYLELSKRLGDAKAIRAVASANGANAISILVPCHRVVGSNGHLTGYAGGLTAKQKLLQLERLRWQSGVQTQLF